MVRRQLVLLGTLIFLAYLPALFTPFLLDDRWVALETPRLDSFGKVLSLFRGAVDVSLPGGNGENLVYRPLSFLSLGLDRLVWWDHPLGFHLTSLLLHLGSTLILFLLVRRWWPGEGCFPLAVAAAWGLLPVNAEAAIYISARHDVLFNFLYLLAFLVSTSAKRSFTFGLYFGLGIAAFLAKEMAVTLPVAVFLHDLIVGPAREGPGAPAPRRSGLAWTSCGHLSLLMVLLTIRYLTVFSSSSAVKVARPDLLFMSSVAWHYLKILGSPLSYSIDRSHDVQASWTAACCFYAALVLGSALLFALSKPAGERQRRVVLFASGWAALAYLPVSNLVPLYSVCADRYLYLPTLGLILACGAALAGRSKLAQGAGSKAWIAATGVMLVLALYRSSFFTGERRLYEVSLAESPGSPLLHNNLGGIDKGDGRLEAAAQHFRKALEIAPEYLEARYNLGALARKTGDYAEAESLLAGYVEAKPLSADGWLQWGLVALGAGDLNSALERLKRADQLRGQDRVIRYYLAVAHSRIGNDREAQAILEEIRRPRSPGPLPEDRRTEKNR